VSTGYYLLDHPNPNTPQFRTPRRERASGVVVVHTDEAPQQPGGSLGTAQFIARRTDYGSYHTIVDSTTTTRLAPPITHEVWGAAQPYGTNSHALHLSFRGQRHRWGQDPGYDDAAIKRAGVEIAGWLRTLFAGDAAKYVRWLTVDDVVARRAGLVEHGTIQPGDRVDPWVRLPDQQAFRSRLSAAVLANLAPPPVPTPPGVDTTVSKPFIINERPGGDPKAKSNGSWVYYTDTPWRIRIKSAEDFRAFRALGVPVTILNPEQHAFFKRNTSEVKTG
jgi:hypothetical protein